MEKISLFPMLRDHVGKAMWGSKNLAFFSMLRDHAGEAMLGCPMVRDHRLAVPLRDHVALSQDRCGGTFSSTDRNSVGAMQAFAGTLAKI